MNKKTKVCFTIDTEGDSANHPHTTFLGIRIALPTLLDLFNAYNIKATFFIQEDHICRVGTQFTKLWRSLEEQGHEIGYHAHGIIRSSLQQQEAVITRGLNTLKENGLNPISYRGGRFHLTGSLLKILEKNGIKYDSSVVPGLREVFQDGVERCNHIGAPVKPYYPSYEDHTQPGDSQILELPINRYTKLPPDMWGGILHGTSKDVILFDFFQESMKNEVIIVLMHSWEGLSAKISHGIRKTSWGKLRKFGYDSLNKIFSRNFLTNGSHFKNLEQFVRYIADKDDVCFTTIQQAGESLAKGD